MIYNTHLFITWAMFLGYHAVAMVFIITAIRSGRFDKQTLACLALMIVFTLCAWGNIAPDLFDVAPWVVRMAHTWDAIFVYIFLMTGGVAMLAGDPPKTEKYDDA